MNQQVLIGKIGKEKLDDEQAEFGLIISNLLACNNKTEKQRRSALFFKVMMLTDLFQLIGILSFFSAK